MYTVQETGQFELCGLLLALEVPPTTGKCYDGFHCSVSALTGDSKTYVIVPDSQPGLAHKSHRIRTQIGKGAVCEHFVRSLAMVQ